MPVDWPFPDEMIQLGGVDKQRISPEDAGRQTETAKTILERLRTQPGVILADEVGMGKTYVAMAVIASVIQSTTSRDGPVVVMTPPGLQRKWRRDWYQFKRYCTRNHAMDRVRDKYARTPTEFFKLLDDPPARRARLIFITTGCFNRELTDPWVKLAMIRLARRYTKLNGAQKRRLYWWAPVLVRRASNNSNKKLPEDEDVVRRLMEAHVREWKRILTEEGILKEEGDDPVPEHLTKFFKRIDWRPLCEVIRELPGWRPGRVSSRLREQVRKWFANEYRSAYEQWLGSADWRSPLLVLDEAHHAKNDTTRLSRLFRQTSEDDDALLKDKFDRMLFLTATPFQLGHQELIRVLRSFGAVRWSRKKSRTRRQNPKAPTGTRDNFLKAMETLQRALDANRLAARRFDRLWGKLRWEMIAGAGQQADEAQHLQQWWERAKQKPADAWEKELVGAYEDCLKSKRQAEELLRPWVIRHNRNPFLPRTHNVPRRCVLSGKAILEHKDGVSSLAAEGLPIEGHALLPFLITAKAQGQLAHCPGTRAFFSEGLASSYEAFHDTRKNRRKAMDVDDGLDADNHKACWLVPTRWYAKQIERLIPSRKAPREKRLAHPKVSATVKHALDLWLGGEKVLIFCRYVETAEALYEHLDEEVNRKTIELAAEKLGLDGERRVSEVQNWLTRIAHRLADKRSPFHREMRALLDEEIRRYDMLSGYREQLLGVMMAYFRAPSFIARYLPLDDLQVRDALGKRESRRDVIQAGTRALRYAVLEQKDASNQTYLGRVRQFLRFAQELAERGERRLDVKENEASDEQEDPLQEYLRAVSVYCKPRQPNRVDDDDRADEEELEDGSYRVMPLVRRVVGKTRSDVRDRLMLAFNSPLFPEILVSSSILGEGVDLHRFCRHVIHHDLCWNPSTLEQRTGRLDRVGCWAEECGRSIEVCEPFLTGSADEKMFRVLHDRERWFQIVMGQEYQFDEATSEAIASRVPLPPELAQSLTFDLSCWQSHKVSPGDSAALRS